jgi:hypothetical protein
LRSITCRIKSLADLKGKLIGVVSMQEAPLSSSRDPVAISPMVRQSVRRRKRPADPSPPSVS